MSSQGPGQEQSNKAADASEDIKKAERWMIVLTVAIVLLTAGLVYVATAGGQ